MKKRLILFLLIFSPFLLTSCYFPALYRYTSRINYFVAGLFNGKNYYDDTLIYLEVNAISKSEYKKAKNINVIKDLVKNKYYSLNMYTLLDGERNILYNFDTLKDYEGSSAKPVTYKDKNACELMPFTYFEKEATYCTYDVYLCSEELSLKLGIFFEPVEVLQ